MQAIELQAAETNIMERRVIAGIDADSKMTVATNNEAEIIRVINQEEKEQKLKNLPNKNPVC